MGQCWARTGDPPPLSCHSWAPPSLSSSTAGGVGECLPNTHPHGAAAAPAGMGRAAAFPGHLLPHFGSHRPAGTGRGPLGAGKLGQQGPGNWGFGAHRFMLGEENPGCGKKNKIRPRAKRSQDPGCTDLSMGAPKAIADTSPPFLLQAQMGGRGLLLGRAWGSLIPALSSFRLLLTRTGSQMCRKASMSSSGGSLPTPTPYQEGEPLSTLARRVTPAPGPQFTHLELPCPHRAVELSRGPGVHTHTLSGV